MPVKYTVSFMYLYVHDIPPEEEYYICKDKVSFTRKKELDDKTLKQNVLMILSWEYEYYFGEIIEFEITDVKKKTI